MHAIRVTETGGPEVLVYAEVADPVPGETDLVVDVVAAGVNFIDTYHRTGLYPRDLPFTPGMEGAGVVATIGPGVSGFSVGDRVAWTEAPGSYAEAVVVPSDKAVQVPGGVATDTAAAVMLQGLTAHYLVNDTFALGPEHRCLIHAGAGGVGRLLIQLAKSAGAEVFATVGSDAKATLAAEAGADHVINYRNADFKQAVEDIAGPHSIDVVYDGVGHATFDDGLGLLRPMGMMVAFGNASGPVDPVDPLQLSRGGSLFLTRPTLFHHIATREQLERRAGDLFSAITAGTLDVLIGERFPLPDAPKAHRALEGRATVGKVLLAPGGSRH